MGILKGRMTRKIGIFTAVSLMQVPGNLSLQGGWAELLGAEMAEKVNDVGVSKQTRLELLPWIGR